MTQAAGAEKYTLFVIPFGVAVKTAAEFAIMQQRFGWFVAVEHRHHILDGHPMTGLVEIHGINHITPFHEAIDN